MHHKLITGHLNLLQYAVRYDFSRKIPNSIFRKSEVATVWIALILIFNFSSCKKFLETAPPTTQIVSATVFKDDATANSAVVGIYSQMSNSGFVSGDFRSISFLSGLSADEFMNYSATPDQVEVYNNDLRVNNSIIQSLWQQGYQFIYYANAVIQGLNNSGTISQNAKNELMGEAKFIRSFVYFYLVNLFGNIPLVTSTDYRINNIATIATKEEIYSQIIEDLREAQNALSEDYSASSGERVRPNKWAATALLSRVYLYVEKYDSARIESDKIINNSSLFRLTSLDSVFLKNSQEAIWQLMPVVSGRNTNEGRTFILTTAAPSNVALSNYLLDAFEPEDQRRSVWVDSVIINNVVYYFPYKYKISKDGLPLSEYSMVLRLSEQYLIRAEAEAYRDNLIGARNDLNIIRGRGGLDGISSNNRDSLLLAIQHERQIELFSELGHRWLDLKRTGRADEILGRIKTGWKPTDALYPIPAIEIANDPNLVQNPGYN